MTSFLSVISQTISAIPPLDAPAMDAARARQERLTKPAGALGRLEALSIHLAGITGHLDPIFLYKRILLCAGDHGVTVEGVSAYPPEVTAQMVLNFLEGGAAINVLARQIGASVTVLDLGITAPLPAHPALVRAKIAPGTQNLARGPAMTPLQAQQAITVGIELVNQLADEGQLDLVILGEMGIGNTTPAAAITAALTQRPATEVTGRGTGLGNAALAHKVSIIEQALALHQPDPADPLDVLAKVGGFEIAGLVGICLAAAARRRPILMDGFIATSAALLAARLAPTVQPYLIAAHRSQERGHTILLEALSLTPLLDLDLRLGEGTGAALAVPLLEAAVALLNQMATFDEAGVTTKSLGEDL